MRANGNLVLHQYITNMESLSYAFMNIRFDFYVCIRSCRLACKLDVATDPATPDGHGEPKPLFLLSEKQSISLR